MSTLRRAARLSNEAQAAQILGPVSGALLAEDVFAHVIPSPFSIVGLTIHHFSKHPSLEIPLVGGGLNVTPTAKAEIKTLLKV
jgi:hypothetical protein